MEKNEENGIPCEFCHKLFSNKYTLSRHQQISCKNIDAKKKYKCKYCKKQYISKSNLERHLDSCFSKKEHNSQKSIKSLKDELKREKYESSQLVDELRQIIKEKDEEIISLKVKCESNLANGKVEVYDKVCTKVLDRPTVTNTNNNAYIHPKLVNLPVTNIHPLTEDYVKGQVDNGGYTFDHYLKGENGLVDFIYSITMCENDSGSIERNYVCTDPSRDSYHRLVETKEWQKDKGGKFVDVILDTISDKADDYHMKLFDERQDLSCKSKGKSSKPKSEYDPDYIYKLNTDMHSGIVQTKGKDRRNLRQKIKKETSRKISV
jgi:hypothetical protein